MNNLILTVFINKQDKKKKEKRKKEGTVDSLPSIMAKKQTKKNIFEYLIKKMPLIVQCFDSAIGSALHHLPKVRENLLLNSLVLDAILWMLHQTMIIWMSRQRVPYCVTFVQGVFMFLYEYYFMLLFFIFYFE